jgi:hypothetical protein
MKSVLIRLFLLVAFSGQGLSELRAEVLASKTTFETETVVFLRHAEKPAKEFGQLNCQGLNRALALPQVLIRKFGRPDYLFAPSPSQRTSATGEQYNYLRPLATIEPTAICLGLPVNTNFKFTDIGGLRRELTRGKYANSRILVVWEHHQLQQLVKQIVAEFHGAVETVPTWENNDFDGIFVIRITSAGSTRSVSFGQDHEGLNHLSNECPGLSR